MQLKDVIRFSANFNDFEKFKQAFNLLTNGKHRTCVIDIVPTNNNN